MGDTRKATCGPFYQEAMREYGTTPEAERAFAAGFISGQAEKVYLGACPAAMFRPSAEKWTWARQVVAEVAARYGLGVRECEIGIPDKSKEIWIGRPGLVFVGIWECFKPDSHSWHLLRGIACGVPLAEIDFYFHQRRGYGEVCDETEQAEATE